jgi:tetratricopeptide (TPR) repeat protein
MKRANAKSAKRPVKRAKIASRPKAKPKPKAKAKPAKKQSARPRSKPTRKPKPVPVTRKGPRAKPVTARPARPSPPAPAPSAAPPRLPDPTVELYESGIRAMYAQRWSEAAKLFRRVVSDDDGAEVDLQERALQQLHVCEDKLSTARAKREDEDPFLLAVVHKNSGEYEEALALCSRGGRQSKDERFAYLVASIHALRGEGEQAGRFLELAIGLNPKNRVHAFHDPDFQSLRESGALERLFRG